MKKILLLSLLAITTSSFGQGLIGPKIGMSISSFRDTKVPDGATKGTYKSMIAPQAGIMFNAKLGDYVALRPELLYVQRGTKTEWGGQTYTSTLHYAELPFNIVGCIPAGPGKVEIFAGPSVGYLFGGNVKGNGYSSKIKGEDEPTHREANDNNTYYNYLNISMNAGIGYNWNGLVFQIGYNLGFSNLNPHAENRDSEAEKNRNKDVTKASAITFGIAYLFGDKD